MVKLPVLQSQKFFTLVSLRLAVASVDRRLVVPESESSDLVPIHPPYATMTPGCTLELLTTLP